MCRMIDSEFTYVRTYYTMGQNHETYISNMKGQVSGNQLLLLLSRLQDLKAAEQALVNAHHGAGIVEFATIVGRAEECDQLALAEELVPVLDHLMSATDEVHVVLLQEARYYVWAESEGHAAIVLAPARDVLVRIGPQQVAQQTAVRNLSKQVSLNMPRLYFWAWLIGGA